MCIFCLQPYYSFILLLYLIYHYISTLAEYQPYVYSTLLFSPPTRTCFSEDEDGVEFFDKKF
jgi:hypothetical protein